MTYTCQVTPFIYSQTRLLLETDENGHWLNCGLMKQNAGRYFCMEMQPTDYWLHLLEKTIVKTMTSPSNLSLAVLLCVTLLAAVGSSSLAQSGLNGGKPIITYNTYGPLPTIKTQTPPSFPGGEDKLNAYVLHQIEEAETPIKLGRKTCLTATLDGTVKVTELVPTYDADPTLKKEVARMGTAMPRWNPGTINGQGVETKFQFLLRR